MSEITRFLEGKGTDSAGRSVREVLAFKIDALENQHDYIQWVFPLREASSAVPDAPVLSENDIGALKISLTAQRNIRHAVEVMNEFFDKSEVWLETVNHNHLRITRIIKSLRILSGNSPADNFKRGILRRVNRARAAINPVTLKFWNEA